MARELNEKQTRFLEVLFEEAGGDAVTAKKMAGYSANTPTTSIVEALKDEIFDATKTYMSRIGEKLSVESTGGLFILPPKDSSNAESDE